MFDLEFFRINTGSGYWDPILWIFAFIIILVIVYVIRNLGKKDFKKSGEKSKVFLSGNPEYDKEQMHIKGSNLYWGFTESMKWLYDILNRFHTGNVSDYVLWFVVVMAALFIVMTISGGI